jgi:signal transduction histidine kinase
VFCLITGGFILSGLFRGAVQESLDDQLRFDLDGLLAAAEVDGPDHVTLQGRFADPRFERVFSGWYWQIDPETPQAAHLQPETSRSLWDQTIVPQDLVATDNSTQWGYGQGPDGQKLRVLVRSIALPGTEEGIQEEGRFRFLVASSLNETEADVLRFNRTLFISLGLFSLGLLAAIAIQVRVGLQPLRGVSEALARIREGRARRLEGEFPTEIAPLASELNSLIAHSSEVVGRARAHVANLAHFLKTPLTVLANEAAASPPSPLSETVSRQVTSMRRQVDHYLARARAAGALDVLGSRTDIAASLGDLSRVLPRMHSEKRISIDLDVTPGLAFRGEREDFEEMAGNLLDNACKWARGRIAVKASALDGGRFQLAIEDDGPGLPPEQLSQGIERGKRLDESVPGTGLGLAIVRDISKLYGGTLTLAKASLGGLKVCLELPRIA